MTAGGSGSRPHHRPRQPLLFSDESGGVSLYWLLLFFPVVMTVGMIMTIGTQQRIVAHMTDVAFSAARAGSAKVHWGHLHSCYATAMAGVDCPITLDAPEACMAAEEFLNDVGWRLPSQSRTVTVEPGGCTATSGAERVVITLSMSYNRILLPGTGSATLTADVAARPHLVTP